MLFWKKDFQDIQMNKTLARGKTLHSTNDHSKRVALATDIAQHLQNRYSFRHKVNELSTLVSPELQHQQNINPFPSAPWQLCTLHFGITGRDDHIDLKGRCSLIIIAS